MKCAILIKIVCIFVFVLITCMTLGSLLTYWRNVHNQFEEFDIDDDDDKVKIVPKSVDVFAIMLLGSGDMVVRKYGVIKNCYKECNWPEDTGFVGDKVIAALLSVTIVIYVINIIIMLTSMFLRNFPPKALYFSPVICFFGTVLIASSIAIFLVYFKTFFAPYEGDGRLILEAAEEKKAASLYKQDDGIVTGPYYLKITYGDAFYVAAVTAGFSLLSIIISGVAAFKSVNDEEEAEAQYEVKIVKIEPPSSE